MYFSFFRMGWCRGWIHILTLFLSLSLSTPLSPLDSPWRNILSPSSPSPTNHLSIPPKLFCPTILDPEQTIQAYNANFYFSTLYNSQQTKMQYLGIKLQHHPLSPTWSKQTHSPQQLNNANHPAIFLRSTQKIGITSNTY